MSEKISPAAYYEKIARRWAGHFEKELDPVVRYLLRGFDVMATDTAIHPQARILDIGCGEGYFLRLLKERFPGACLVGLDSGREMLEIARGRSSPEIQLVLGNALQLPALGKFDVVFCAGLTEHFTDEENRMLFREINKALSPSGKVVVRFVNKYSSWYPVMRLGYRKTSVLYRGHTVRGIRALACESGFTIEKVEGDYAFPVLLYWLSRLMPAKFVGRLLSKDRIFRSWRAPWACRHFIVSFALL